jgi:hypothetical protein
MSSAVASEAAGLAAEGLLNGHMIELQLQGLPSFNTCAAALNGLVSERPLTDEDNVEDYADRLADAICTVAAGSVSSESSHERGVVARQHGYDRFEAVVPDLTFEFGHVDLATAPRQELQRAPGEGEAFHSGGGLLSGEDLFGAHKEPSPLTGTADDADTGHEVIRFSDDPLVGASVGRRYTDVWQQERRRPGSSPLHNKLHASEPGRREVEVYWDGETSRQLPKCMTATTET